MTNTITNKTAISALRYNDYIGVDDTSNSGQTLKATPEQFRDYTAVGFGSTLPTFRAKLAGVKVSANNCRVLMVGDSITLGLHSAGATSNDAAFSWTSIAQRYFSMAGITAQRDAILGNGDGSTVSHDARLTIGNAWGAAAQSIGGQVVTATTNTNAYTFAPTGIVDTFKVYYVTVAAGGTIAIDIDGGGATTQTTAGANGIASKTVTATAPGIHVCNVKWNAGGAVFIIGIEATNSKISQLQILQAGWSGGTTVNMATNNNVYDPLGGLKAIAPDLTILAAGVNDWLLATNTTTFSTAYQSLITAALISGDCICLLPPPSAATTIPQATQDTYINIIRGLAATNNCPVIDIYDRFQNTVFSASIYFDDRHPNGKGYEVMGEAVYNFLNISGPGSSNPPSIGIPLLIQTVANNTYTYVGYAGSAGTVLGVYEKARALTTAGTFAIAINGTNITGLSAVVPTTAGSYNYATALNTYARGAQITVVYTSTSAVLDHTLTLDIVQPQVAL